MAPFSKLRERFRDKFRDELCATLQSTGIDARLAERGRAEEKTLSGSLGIIDIDEGPIRWINVSKWQGGGETGGSYRNLVFGVPDTRLTPSFRKSKFPVFGDIIVPRAHASIRHGAEASR